MTLTQYLFAIAGAFLMHLSMAQQIDYKGFPQWSWGKKDSTEYYLYVPSNLRKNEKYPLVLFLHGCCGEDYHATLRNAVDPPVRMWHDFGKNMQSIPTFILSPKTRSGWRQHFANLKAVMDSLIARGVGDPQRMYITGFSMGARGTWEFIEAYPDYFAAAVPMGMDFKVKDAAKFAYVPIWTIRGDQDWWARHLGTQVRAIRSLSMGDADSAEWHTGINPRLTNFEGMGHVVMWTAASHLDIKEWMYSKVNDGNKYPLVMLKTPSHIIPVHAGVNAKVTFEAFDPDGEIKFVELFVHGKKRVLPPSARSFVVMGNPGDHPFELTVVDDKGKRSTASGILRSDVPAKIITHRLPAARAGQFISLQLKASGNGSLAWSTKGPLPSGLRLSKDGRITGIAESPGEYRIEITAQDESNDIDTRHVGFTVLNKRTRDVVVSNARNYKGDRLPLSIVAEGSAPHLRSDDEVTLSSDPGIFHGLTMIVTHPSDSSTSEGAYLRFNLDEDATVYIAYEKLDNLFRSTIPSLLQVYRHVGSLTAQYYYYDVYAKDFPKGEVVLPDPDRKRNGVNNNYFVMVKKKENP